MNVLHVVPSLSALHGGGVSSSVRDLCRGLAENGVSVRLMTTERGLDPQREIPPDEELRRAGVALDYFPVHSWRWLGQGFAYSPALRDALDSLRPEPDVVHVHGMWLYTTRLCARFALKRRIPYVISPCGALDPYGLRSHPLFKRAYGFLVERRSLEGASRVHFTSDMEQKKAFLFGANPPATIIPRSIAMEELRAVPQGAFRRRFPEATEAHLLLFMGRLHPKKRLDIAVEAFIRVAQKRRDVRLVVAGRDEGAGPAARALLSRSGMLDRATFCGFLAGREKWEALADSRLFLLPSEDENFGVAALEAMAAGVPALLSPGVALSKDVVRSGAGLCLDPSPEVWSRSVESLLEGPARVAEMAAAGRRLVEAEFSTKQVASRMQALYRQILSRKTADGR